MTRIRTTARGVVRQGNRLLVIQYRDAAGLLYAVPGGMPRPGEPLPEAVRREIREEAAADVEVGDVIFVREFTVGPSPLFDPEEEVHQIEIFFDCRLVGDRGPAVGPSPDQGQTGVMWMGIDRLRAERFYPLAMLDHLDGRDVVYLGMVD